MNPTKRIERNHEHRDRVRADDSVRRDALSDWTNVLKSLKAWTAAVPRYTEAEIQSIKDERDDYRRMWQEQVVATSRTLTERATADQIRQDERERIADWLDETLMEPVTAKQGDFSVTYDKQALLFGIRNGITRNEIGDSNE